MDLANYLRGLRIPAEIKGSVKNALPLTSPVEWAILRVMARWDEVSGSERGVSKTVDPVFVLNLTNDRDEFEWWRLERLKNLGLAADMGARSPINQVRITEAGRWAHAYLLSEGVYERQSNDAPPAETGDGRPNLQP